MFVYIYNNNQDTNQMNELKNLKWTPDQQKFLKQLREDQINKKIVNWEQIAHDLNQNFPKVIRTSKQCRQKYINHSRLQSFEKHSDWSQEELHTLVDLYQQYGPSWAYFSTKITNRSQNSLKNKFHNGLRRISKILYCREGELYKHTKKSITTEMLIAMIDFVNQLQKAIIQSDFTINLDSMFFSFRSQILKLALFNYQPSYQQISELVRKIKALNCKIRCFGIFKVKNRKNWKLSKKGLFAVCQYDKAINEQISNLDQKYSELTKWSKIDKKTSLSSPIYFETQEKQDIPLLNFSDDFESFKPLYDLEPMRLEDEIKEIIGEESQIFQFGRDFFY